LATTVFCLSSCDTQITNTDVGPAYSETNTASTLSKRGGKGGGKGSAPDYDQLLEGALVGHDSVQIAADSRKKLETLDLAFDLAFDFNSTAGQGIVDVQDSGLSVDDILAAGDCSFECPDIDACEAAPGGRSAIIGRLHSALTRADSRALEISILISKQDVGSQHANHFVSVRDRGGPEDAAAGYPHLNLGRNHTPQNFLKADFAGPDINDDTVTRVFTLSSGTVHLWERVGVAAGADLICDNLDTVVVTLDPLGN
jgi:hypothetical protein